MIDARIVAMDGPTLAGYALVMPVECRPFIQEREIRHFRRWMEEQQL